MATLDQIDITGGDSAAETISAFYSAENNGSFSFDPNSLPLLEAVPTSPVSSNNFHFQFNLTEAQTAAFNAGSADILIENAGTTKNAVFDHTGFIFGGGSNGGFANPSQAIMQFNTIGQTGATGATGATGPQGVVGATGSTGPQGSLGPTGPVGATGAMGSVGVTGPAGATGPQGIPGPKGTTGDAASVGIETVTAAQNADGTTTFNFSGGPYFDGESYSAVSDTRDATGALTVETRDKNNGSHATSIYQGGQTVTSNFFDTFQNNGAPDTIFVFNPGFGRDVVNLFRVDGADHDTLSFKGSDYGNDIATVLASARNTNAGLLITNPTASSPGDGPGTHDTLLLKGITKQQLAANQADITFHA